MKITLVNRSDSLGGAAIVTVRLLRALRSLGHDARLLVFDPPAAGLHPDVVSRVGTPLSRTASFLTERLAVMAACGLSRRRLFLIDPAITGIDISRHPWIREADAVILNWVNQGMLSLSDIRRIAAVTPRLLVTMHDMWWMTGVCHHAHSCRRFKDGCGRCPLLGWMKSPSDLSRRTYEAKTRLYADASPTFVAVSNWLADLCLLSPAMRGIRPHVCLIYTTPSPRD
ncbi:MAG: glycosyltransferase [Muribaculaceae bacterium]|nr:glycosyltransferase [Muribaculaceae bacterium]